MKNEILRVSVFSLLQKDEHMKASSLFKKGVGQKPMGWWLEVQYKCFKQLVCSVSV